MKEMAAQAIGSPPRAWGRLPRELRRDPQPRITPTGVGTALPRSAAHKPHADHPHGRGDGIFQGAVSVALAGSPPRAWGRRLSTATTWAGCGSPPRAWGRPGRPGRGDGPGRITPTGVGTATVRQGSGASRPDHPHGRGDGEHEQRACLIGSGSPPRAWGRLLQEHVVADALRITPTGVGTAAGPGPAGGACPDHPHGRGDGRTAAWRRPTSAGSPPRAWGRPVPARLPVPARRITPTGVGTARAWSPSAPRTSDHPHGRGDGVVVPLAGRRAGGSPPRAWGRLRNGLE